MEVLHVDDMSFDIDHNLKRNLFSQTGRLTLENAVASMEIQAGLDENDPSYDTLVDYSGLSGIDITADEIKAIVDGLNAVDQRTGKVALVVGADYGRFALMKLFCDLTTLKRDNPYRAFEDIEEARDWLAQ